MNNSFFQVRPRIALPAGSALAEKLKGGWQLYQKLDRSQWLPAAELWKMQTAQLRALLDHCVRHVPYYRQALADYQSLLPTITSREDLEKLPVLARTTLQAQGEELTAETLPPGITAGGLRTTSGTTGMPLKVKQSNLTNIWWVALCLRDLEWGKVDLRGTVASIRAFGVKPEKEQKMLLDGIGPLVDETFHPLMETGPCYFMEISQRVHKQVEWLLKINPTYILSYPSNLSCLAHLVQERKPPFPNLRSIRAIAEPLTRQTKALVEAAFGVPVLDIYSCTEAGYVASVCPQGSGLHVHAENVIVEVVDARGKAVGPGETGKVLLTVLHNYLQPLIRYAIGDEATLGPTSCSCGRGLPLLQRVDGKLRPMLLLPNGERKNAAMLGEAFYVLGGFRQRQIIQKSKDLVVINVVPGDGWTDDHVQRTRDMVQGFFEGPINVDIRVMPEILLPEHGKFRDYICEV